MKTAPRFSGSRFRGGGDPPDPRSAWERGHGSDSWRGPPRTYDQMLATPHMRDDQRAQILKMQERRRQRQQKLADRAGRARGEQSAQNSMAEKGADVLESARKMGTDQKKQELGDIDIQLAELDKIEELDKQIQELKRERASVLERKGLAHSKVGQGIKERMLSMRIDHVRPKSTELSMGKGRKSRGGGKCRVKKGKTMKRRAKKSKRGRRRSRTRRR